MKWYAVIGASMAIASVSGCACRSDRVVLLPDENGVVGKIMVKRQGGETLISTAYASVQTTQSGLENRQQVDAAIINADFGPELAALPQRPSLYRLYFLNDTDDFDAESTARVPMILAAISKRPAPEVIVVGHTDTVGPAEYNDTLSLARAEVVKNSLLKVGIDPARISIAGRGERDARSGSRDEVADPADRYAEIIVR